MLDEAAINGLKVLLKMEELEAYLKEKISDAGREVRALANDVENDDRWVAIQASEYSYRIQKCFEVIDIIDTIKDGVDGQVDKIYDRIFRNVLRR